MIYIIGFSGWCLHTELRQEETGKGQTINSYTNKPINKFKVHALLDDTLSCTHKVRVDLDKSTNSKLAEFLNKQVLFKW